MARPAALQVALPAFFVGALLASGASAAPAALPALPGANSPAPVTGPTAPVAGGSTEVNGFTADQVRRGIVQVEQGGRPLGVGTVLLKDGRILTSLSALANV